LGRKAAKSSWASSARTRIKPVDADEEILLTYREMWQLSGQADGVTLITGDIAMRMRAEATRAGHSQRASSHRREVR
jgi:hypothetical protein